MSFWERRIAEQGIWHDQRDDPVEVLDLLLGQIMQPIPEEAAGVIKERGRRRERL